MGTISWIVVIAGLAVGALFLIDPEISYVSNDTIRQEIRAQTSPEALDARINAALDRDDYDTAVMYADVADFAGITLSQETLDRIEREGAWAASTLRNARQFSRGFLTGEADSIPGLSGAVASDLTVIGDVRDLSTEGGKMLAGQDYNQLILGLSVVGVGLTGATIATGGATLTGRVGVSIVKIASKTGAMTLQFSRYLTRLVTDAVDFPALRQTLRSVDMGNPRATRAAVENYAASVRTAGLFPVLERVEDISRSTSPAESLRLMRYVDTGEDLEDMAQLSNRMGRRTRGVIEITGKTSLRAFRTTVKLLRVMLDNILAFLGGLGSLIAAVLGRRGLRAVRGR